MLLGRVIGTVVPAMLVEEMSATPLLWVQPLDREGEPEDESLDDVALDDSEVELDVDVELVDDLEEPPRESFL